MGLKRKLYGVEGKRFENLGYEEVGIEKSELVEKIGKEHITFLGGDNAYGDIYYLDKSFGNMVLTGYAPPYLKIFALWLDGEEEHFEPTRLKLQQLFNCSLVEQEEDNIKKYVFKRFPKEEEDKK